MRKLVKPKLVQFNDGQFGVRSGFSLFRNEKDYRWLNLKPQRGPFLCPSSYRDSATCRGTILEARAALRRYKRAYKTYLNINKIGYKVLGEVKDDE